MFQDLKAMAESPLKFLFAYLPPRISRAICLLPDEIIVAANEIRLRRRAPISLTVGAKNIMFDESGRVCNIASAMKATDREIDECITRLTGGSRYTCDEFVIQGFIPLSNGGRAGVCGRANIKNGKTNGFLSIDSVDLRISRFLPDVATPLISEFKSNGLRGTLVCSPPALGKTTFLRSAAYLLANGKGISPKRVGIADERGEISAGISDIGLADIIVGAPKSEAVTILTRTMSPEVLICDEISANEADLLIEAQNTGVCLIGSAHCVDPSGLIKRGRLRTLVESGIFPLCVILKYDNGYRFDIAETEAFL